jgi:ABC-2 type transport system permease protein
MRKTILVLRNEILTAFQSKSFLFFAFGVPLIAAVIVVGISVIKGDTPDASVEPADSTETSQLQVEGYVDHSGLIKALHPDVPPGILVAFPDEPSARQALDAGQIAAYYVIPSDYVESGDLVYINPGYRPASSEGQSWVMRRTLFANLLGNDAERIARASIPMDLQVKALNPETQQTRDGPLTFFIPYVVMLSLYLVIMMSASLLLHSVGNEKKNRVMEVLLLSVSPRQMLTGKIVGLGILGLLQAAIWLGTGYALLRISGQTFDLPVEFALPPSILVWGIVFCLLGYAVYASLMASLGALAPNPKEASQGVILVIWPLLIPMLFLVVLIENTHGLLATALSLFPLTAPIAMMTRLAVGGVPSWQPLLSAVLLLATAILIVRATAGVFQAQILLSGQPVSIRQFYSAFLGRRRG